MEISKEIQDKLILIGNKYADKVLEDGVKLDSARKAFSISERAFKLVLDIDNRQNVFVDAVRKFAAQIDARMRRSDTYRSYIDFCLSIECEPVSRNDFFRKLRELKFSEKRLTDGYYFIPPDRKVRSELFSESDITSVLESCTEKRPDDS